VVTAHGVDIHSSLQALKDSGAVSAMATQYTSTQKPLQPQQQPRSSPPTNNGGAGQPVDAVATPPPSFVAPESESTESITVNGGHDVTAVSATSDAFATNVDTTTMPDETTAPDLSTSVPTSIPSKVSFMFGILSSKDEIPVVDGYLAQTEQLARTIIMDNPNTFQSVSSSMSYPIATSIEKDHSRTDACRYMVTVCISFTASDDATAKEFQNQLVEGIRIAIMNGSFTKNL
jgi:hypothetical protein